MVSFLLWRRQRIKRKRIYLGMNFIHCYQLYDIFCKKGQKYNARVIGIENSHTYLEYCLTFLLFNHFYLLSIEHFLAISFILAIQSQYNPICSIANSEKIIVMCFYATAAKQFLFVFQCCVLAILVRGNSVHFLFMIV